MRPDGCVGLRPQHDAGGCEDFKGFQHVESCQKTVSSKGEVTVSAEGAVVAGGMLFAVADWAKAMVELGAGAALQPRINTSPDFIISLSTLRDLPLHASAISSRISQCTRSQNSLYIQQHHVPGLLRTAARTVAASSPSRPATCLNRADDALTTSALRSTDP